jgi:hypothetical protein
MFESIQPAVAMAQPMYTQTALETIAMAQPMYTQPAPAVETVAMAQPMYAQTAVSQSFSTTPAASVGAAGLDMLNQAISLGEVAKPSGALAYYDLYCKMSSQAMPTAVATTATVVPQQPMMMETVVAPTAVAQQAMVAPQPMMMETVVAQQARLAPQAMMMETVMQSPSYLPPAPVVVETVPSYAAMPGATEKVYSYLPPAQYAEPPMAVAAPAMAAPAMMQTVAAPGIMSLQQAQPESVILDEVGEWLICEDAMGLFYHHSPSQQSYDQPPVELVQYYERCGVQLAPTGAFGVQAQMVQAAPMQMNYAGPAMTTAGAYF